jgi:hypothetical protein
LVWQLGAASLPERRVEVGEVTAFADQQRLALATALAEAADVPHDWVGLGRLDAGRLMLFVADNRAEFQRWSRGRSPGWGAGITFAGTHVVMIRADLDDPYQTLRHELAHVALHQMVHVRVPLWFDEGYAVVAAKEYGRLATLRLNFAVATGKVPELRALDGALRGSADDAESAYALAGSAVAELARRCPNGDLHVLMEKLEAGTSFDAAVLGATGYTIERFETLWLKDVRQHYNWFVWFATGGTWLIVTLVLSWAASSRKRREAPRRAALDVGWPMPPEDDETITIEGVGPRSS